MVQATGCEGYTHAEVDQNVVSSIFPQVELYENELQSLLHLPGDDFR